MKTKYIALRKIAQIYITFTSQCIYIEC